jgi:hypothetical protein
MADLPSDIEREIQRFADQERLSQEEAVLRLIVTGLTA